MASNPRHPSKSSPPEPASSSAGAETRVTAPDWERIPFTVPCRRCGSSLNGSSTPRCPQCGLEFTWDEALPLEALRCGRCDYRLFGLTTEKCPECGTDFDWGSALQAARSRSNRLFEHLWFDRPLPGLWRTWGLSVFRPRRLWSWYDLHDPPRVGPLLLLIAIQYAVFYWGWPVMGQGAD